ncbi:MAG: hypothetical protein DHS20C13_27080 [Thermodesulfobacteriota bacterium]|nr:MAG: hypothetical protein DHS20C13_27080 [Thermodesulfobacteriota bacterium]
MCSVCESGAINYQVNNNERVCVNKDSVKNVYEDANLDFTIVGCISYTHTPAVVCDKCEAGKYLAEDFLSCGTCDGSTNTVVAYEIDGSTTKNFNYCKAFADPDD